MIAPASQYIAIHAPWLLTVMVVWVVLYFLVLRFLNIGVRRIPRSVRRADAQCMPISIIVSARNEERDLPACIASLLALEYPRKLLQIVLVNDRSADNTGAIIDAAAAAHSHLKALRVNDAPPPVRETADSGIARAFSVATGEWMLIAAANGTVRPEWAHHLLGYVDDKTGVAGGALLARADGWLGAVQRMSYAFLQTFNFGLTGWGAPLVAAASNIAVHRTVYAQWVNDQSVRATPGASHNAPQSRIVDNFALFRIAQAHKLAVHLYMDQATTETLAPVASVGELLAQHRRWLGAAVGKLPSFSGALLSAIVWGWGVAMFIAVGWLLDWRVWTAFIVLKTTHDFLMLRLQQKRTNTPHHVRYLPVLELYLLVTFAILPIIFLFRQRTERNGAGYSVRNS